MPKYGVIIAGAGKSERFGGQERKTLAKLDGRPLFLRTIELFAQRDDICQTILVISGADLKEVSSRYGANLGFMGVTLTEGGDRRRDSVAAALGQIHADAEYVAIHDAARPCTSPKTIDAVFAEAVKSGAAILAVPLHGTIKRVTADQTVDQTISREGLYEAQTPQVFRRDLILEAYAHPPPTDLEITDDAQLVELAGHPVAVVRSDATNLKITTREDIALANAILKNRAAAQPTRRLGAFEEAQW